MADESPSWLAATGYLALGSAFVLKGVELTRTLLQKPTPRGGLLGESLAVAQRRTAGAIQKSSIQDVRSIDERLAAIRRLVLKGSLDPRVRERALAVLTRKCGVKGNQRWCTPSKDFMAEITALFESIRDPNSPTAIRYTRDHLEVDQFTGADKTLFNLRAGDCDDQTIALGAMLRSVGYPVRARVIQAKGASTWSHIFVKVGVPPSAPTRWVALDPTVAGAPVGWEPPANMVAKTRDFEM